MVIGASGLPSTRSPLLAVYSVSTRALVVGGAGAGVRVAADVAVGTCATAAGDATAVAAPGAAAVTTLVATVALCAGWAVGLACVPHAVASKIKSTRYKRTEPP